MSNLPIYDDALAAAKTMAHTPTKVLKEPSPGKMWPFHQRDLSTTLAVSIQDMSELTHTDTAMIMYNMLEALVPVIAGIEKMEAFIQSNKEAMQTGNRDLPAGETPIEVKEASVELAETLRDNYRKIKMASDRFRDLVNYHKSIERKAILDTHVRSTFRIFGD